MDQFRREKIINQLVDWYSNVLYRDYLMDKIHDGDEIELEEIYENNLNTFDDESLEFEYNTRIGQLELL